MLTFMDWLKAKENTARTAMAANYPLQYYAGQYPPLAVTPISANAARAYTQQYKVMQTKLRGAKKKKKHKKKKD